MPMTAHERRHDARTPPRRPAPALRLTLVVHRGFMQAFLAALCPAVPSG
jgi:hypothetical protein